MNTILFTRSQAADMLQVKSNTIYKWEKAKIIKPDFHVNGRPRYSFDELERVAYERNNPQTTNPKVNG